MSEALADEAYRYQIQAKRRILSAGIVHGHAKLAIQAGISIAALIFSAIMLIRGNEMGVYLPIITSILGTWAPSPAFAHADPDSSLPHMPEKPPPKPELPKPEPPKPVPRKRRLPGTSPSINPPLPPEIEEV